MKKSFLLILSLLTILLFNFSSCKKGPYEDCTVDFRVDFIDKNTGECYRSIESLLSAYELDTICMYAKPNSFGGVKGRCIYQNEDNLNRCLSLLSGGVDFDKKSNPIFTYAIGKAPNFIDTIELKYKGSVAEIRINGVLQEQKATCGERTIIHIIK